MWQHSLLLWQKNVLAHLLVQLRVVFQEKRQYYLAARLRENRLILSTEFAAEDYRRDH